MVEPTIVTKVRRFIGLANYLGRYAKDLTHVCEPLRQLTRQQVEWQWSHEHSAAFEQLKSILTTAPVLAIFNLELTPHSSV